MHSAQVLNQELKLDKIAPQLQQKSTRSGKKFLAHYAEVDQDDDTHYENSVTEEDVKPTKKSKASKATPK